MGRAQARPIPVEHREPGGVAIRVFHPHVLAEHALEVETEAPRGQMGFYVVGNGEGNPLRVRAKSSCFCNVAITDQICRDVPLADVPAIVGSLDIVMGEIDR